MTRLERLRQLPRRRVLAAVAAAIVAAVILILATVAPGADPVTTADPVATTRLEPVAAPSAGPTSSAGSTATTQQATSAVVTTPIPISPAAAPTATIDLDAIYELGIDVDVPAVEGRSIPDPPSDDLPEPTAEPPWAVSTRLTVGGHIGTDVGCASDRSAAALDRFLSSRVGPVLGWDYQHVYPLGGDRYLWLFQDAFLDHTGTATTLGSARFVHNAAMLQDGDCFTLLHRGSADRPDAFEVGDGNVDLRTRWLWPMGGELVADRLHVFWAEMVKDPYDPDPPDGLGWHPNRTFLASYDASTLERVDYRVPPNPGVAPIYGYAVASDETHTYLFGNTFEQNMVREGGFWNGPHSATQMYLARVPLGQLTAAPEYAAGQGWSDDPDEAMPIVDRFYAENPMQPRFLDGQWVAATAVDGYWGDHLAIDVAPDPWGPWSTIEYSPLLPRNADPAMNTYHAHVLPWRDAFGSVQIAVSNNARNMRRDAWGNPHRYRPTVFFRPYTPTPPAPTTTTPTTTSATTTAVASRPTTTTTTSPNTSTTTTTPVATTVATPVATTVATPVATTTTPTTTTPTTTTSTTTTSTTTSTTTTSTTTSTTSITTNPTPSTPATRPAPSTTTPGADG